MNTFQHTKEFHRLFEVNKITGPLNYRDHKDLIRARLNFLLEEVGELSLALGAIINFNTDGFNVSYTIDLTDKSYDIVEVADALADIDYFNAGTADLFNIPHDLVVYEVHQSNLSKLGLDGRPILRGDGKVLKGPNYHKPDIRFVLSSPDAYIHSKFILDSQAFYNAYNSCVRHGKLLKTGVDTVVSYDPTTAVYNAVTFHKLLEMQV